MGAARQYQAILGCSLSISSDFALLLKRCVSTRGFGCTDRELLAPQICRDTGCFVLPIGAFSPIGCPAMPDRLVQSVQCRAIKDPCIPASRLPSFPDCPIGRISPYSRLQPSDRVTDSIHWPALWARATLGVSSFCCVRESQIFANRFKSSQSS